MNVNGNGHREDILNAAIEVFGRVGYTAASTNEIVKRAKVSKGLLFHHFTNKETLYSACQLHVLDEYARFMVDNFDTSSTDFFDRILSNVRIKMEFGRKNPEYLSLVNRAWYADGEENNIARKVAEEYITKSSHGSIFLKFLDGIDSTAFREGVDIPKVLTYTRMTIEASWAQYYKGHQNDPHKMADYMDDYLKECEEIIELFRNGSYPTL